MAVLTTLVGLLELKHLQMEGEDGTGSLESDIQLMEVHLTTSDALPALVCSLHSACMVSCMVSCPHAVKPAALLCRESVGCMHYMLPD